MRLNKAGRAISVLLATAALTVGVAGTAATSAEAEVAGPGWAFASTDVSCIASRNQIQFMIHMNGSLGARGLYQDQAVAYRMQIATYKNGVWGSWRALKATTANPYGWQLNTIDAGAGGTMQDLVSGLQDGYHAIRMTYSWYDNGWHTRSEVISQYLPTYRSYCTL